jgi:hypothetical protein
MTGVNLADVEEHIQPLKFNKKTGKLEENSHWVGLKTKMLSERRTLDEYHRYKFIAANLNYLKSNRIELGAITAIVGPQTFWDWLKDKILKEFPNRDYNRAIYVPETVMPQDYLDFDAAFKNKIKSILKPSHESWRDKLSDYEGFIDNTGDKYDEIENNMSDNLMMDNTIRQLMKDLNKLKQKYT